MASTAQNNRITEKFQKQLGTKEPTSINPINYKIDLLNALNSYNLLFDNKDKRKWAVDYLKKTNPSVISKIEKNSDYEFRTLGTLIRMKEKNIFLEDNELMKIDTILKELIVKQKKMPEEVSENSMPRIDTSKQKINEVFSTLSYAVDDYLISDESLPDVTKTLEMYFAPRNICSSITSFMPHLEEEIQLAIDGTNEDINDAYSFTTKAKLKKLKTWMENVIPSIQAYSSAVKAKAPRVSKPKSPLLLIKNLKYKIEDATLNLKSVIATSIIGSSTVWLYDTEKRKLSVYNGDNITVRGTTLLNYDPTKSGVKTLRKPEIITSLVSLAKKPLLQEFEKLSTVPQKVNGRLNENTIILKVFN